MRDLKPIPTPITLKELAGDGGSEIITHMSWCSDILTDKPAVRAKKANQILADIACYNSKNGKPTAEGLKLAHEYADPTKYQLIGFVNMVSYVKATGTKAELGSTFIHPLSEALLLFKKDSCCLIIAGADVRFGKSYLSEITENRVHHSWLESGDGIKS
jgi:hypothetical protein